MKPRMIPTTVAKKPLAGVAVGAMVGVIGADVGVFVGAGDGAADGSDVGASVSNSQGSLRHWKFKSKMSPKGRAMTLT